MAPFAGPHSCRPKERIVRRGGEGVGGDLGEAQRRTLGASRFIRWCI
jgi:hypothetical protein